MTIVSLDADGLRRAGDVLERGRPIVVPFPTPLPYVLAGADPAAVNRAKGRPADQPLGLVAADFALLRPYVRLDPDMLAFARWLTGEQRLNLLLPAAMPTPAWLRPSVADGWLAITLAWLEPLAPLLEPRGHLYLSSGNRTGETVAVTAADADAAFDAELLVVDGDAVRDPRTPSGSATMLRVRPDGLDLVRGGIHDATHGGPPDRFLRDLTHLWNRRRGVEAPDAPDDGAADPAR